MVGLVSRVTEADGGVSRFIQVQVNRRTAEAALLSVCGLPCPRTTLVMSCRQ